MTYYLLNKLDKLPAPFRENGNISKIEQNFDNKIKSKDYRLLLTTFLNIPKEDIENLNESFDIIFIDEAQDLDKFLFNIIEYLGKIWDFNLYVYGDIYQKIYEDYRTNQRIKFDIFKYIESKYPDKVIYSNISNCNHRTNNEALWKFINGYIEKNYDNPLLYSNPVRDISNRFARIPIRWFSHKNKEFDYVVSEVKKINKDNSIVVLSRFKRDLKMFEVNRNLLGDDVKISTIHKFKGLEADFVFFVGFQKNDLSNLFEKNVLYTGITRAKEKLIITSAYPEFDLSNIFKEDTFVSHGKQTHSKPYKKLKTIKEGKNFTWNKLKDNYIDSITVAVNFKNAPFLPYLEDRSKTKNGHGWQKQMTISSNGVSYTVRYHKSHKNYYFDFFDLNLLKKNSYSAEDILKFIINLIEKFFDYRITREDMDIVSLDICKFIKFEQDNMESYLKRLAHYIYKSVYENGNSNKKTPFINVCPQKIVNGKKILFYDEMEITKAFLGKNTVYANYSNSKNYTFVFYFPMAKVNKNKIWNKNLFKIECRLKGSVLKTKYAEKVSTMAKLLETVKKGELKYFLKEMHEKKGMINIIGI